MGYGERLRHERQRLGMTQANFAATVGTDSQKQSLYETSKRELRADYLAAAAAAGVDVYFVLTGKRLDGAALADDEGHLLDGYRALPHPLKLALRVVASAGARSTGNPPIVELPSEDALARMFRAMLLPLNLGDALEDTARTFAQQLPASLETAAPAHQPPGRGEVPDHGAPVPAPATGRPASGQEPRT